MSAFRSLAGAAALASLALSACSSKDNAVTGPTVPAATAYSGFIVGAAVTGKMSITFPTAVASLAGRPPFNPDVVGVQANISATLTLSGGGTVNLTGTYTAPNISLSGSSWTFTGTLTNGVVTGTFTGPSGTGDFEALSSPSGSAATVLCGTSSGVDNTNSPTSGIFKLIVGSSVFLVIVDDQFVLPRGSYTGTAFDAYTKTVNPPGGGSSTITISGSLNNAASPTGANGNYSVHNSDGSSEAGTWTSGACP